MRKKVVSIVIFLSIILLTKVSTANEILGPEIDDKNIETRIIPSETYMEKEKIMPENSIMLLSLQDYEYKSLSDGTIEIIRYNGTDTNVIIPSKIDGRTVTSIGDYAFYENYSLKSVVIPNTIKTINTGSFACCYNLNSLTLGSSVETIKRYAFRECHIQGDLTIPDSVKNIESQAFGYNYEIKKFIIGKGANKISETAFIESKFDSFEVKSGNTVYSSKDGVLYSKDQTKLIAYPTGNVRKQFSIPNTVKIIGSYSFTGAYNLTSLTMPDSVTTIEYAAFADMYGITSLKLSKNIEQIDEYAFNNMNKLEEITLPAKLKKIYTTAFISCDNLKNIYVDSNNQIYTSINGVLCSKDKKTLILYPQGRKEETYTIPNTITTIGENAFIDSQIVTITIPSNVTTLGDWCFARTKLTSVLVPSTVKKVGDGPFSDCKQLVTANIQSSADIPYMMFEECTSLKNVTLNNNIKNIGSRAFYNCSSLTSITLPEKLETISMSFMKTGLTNIVIPAEVKSILAGAFPDTTKVDISKTKLTKISTGAYIIVNYVYVNGELKYDYAYKVLEIVNQKRRAEKLPELKMEESLLESAMIRATELSIYYSHTRPNNGSCFSLNSKMSRENIAAGYTTPDSVMNGWMNSSGHRANILSVDTDSIGIGCFYADGCYYWVQCFGTTNINASVKQKSNINKTAKIETIPDYISLKISNTEKSLENGKTLGAEKIININTGWNVVGVYLQHPSVKWTSSNTKVATVDDKGNVKGVGFGTAKITGFVGTKSISYTVNVKLPFIDIKTTDWYYNPVVYSYTNKIIYGTSDTKFSPNNKLTRGMLVTILWRMEGSPKVEGKVYSDVKETEYYYEAIKWAASKKVVNGYDDGKFRPNNYITREQLATILMNYANYKKKDVKTRADLTKYIDNKGISSYAKDAVSWAVAKKVMSGKENGTKVDPQGTATRAEAAAMITNYCNYIGR